MYELPLLTDFEIVRRVGWALIHSLWQISIVVGIVSLLNLMLAKQRSTVRYLICCVGMLFCVVIPIGTFATLGAKPDSVESVSSLPSTYLANDVEAVTNSVETTSPSTNQEFIAIAAEASSQPVGSDLLVVENADIEKNTITFDASQSAKKVETSSVVLPLGKRFSLVLDAWLPTVFWTWIVGVIILAFRPLTGILFIRRLRMRGRSSVPEYVSRTMIEACKQLRLNDAVEIAQSTLVEIPSVIGYFNPLVLLPVSAMTGLNESQLRAIIIHELAHIRRHDYLVNLMQTVVESLLFYHPLLWYLSAQIRVERENCCDDVVLEHFDDRREYVCALIKLESRGQQQTAIAMNASGGSLVNRVRRIAGKQNSPSGNTWLAGLIVLALLALIPTFRSARVLAVQADSVAKSTDTIDDEMRSTTKLSPTTEAVAVAGRVIDEAGQPIEGAVVVQYGKSKSHEYSQFDVPDQTFETLNRAVTDSSGNFKFTSYDFDHAYVTQTFFLHSDYMFRRVSFPFDVFGETVLDQGDDITGRILSDEGKPIEGVKIDISVPNPEITGVVYGHAETNSDGRFVLGNAGFNGYARLNLKLPDQFTQQIDWYKNDGVDHATERARNYPKETVFGQNFEFRLEPLRTVNLRVIAEDTRQPISLDRATYHHFVEAPREAGYRDPPWEITANNNLIKFEHLKPGVNRFWLFPTDTAQYPAVFVDVNLADNETSVPDIEVQITRGARIEGKVADKATGEPIADALIKFKPNEPERLFKEGIIARQFCRSEDDGSFSVVLPVGEFDVQIVGDCGNYRTIRDNLESKTPDERRLRRTPQDTTAEIVKRIELKAGDRIDIGIFRLEQGTKATGIVSDAQGKPLANVGFISERRRIRFGITDAKGRFEIGSLFTNGSFIATAEVCFFDVDRGMSEWVTIKEKDAKDLRITLDKSPAVTGRVIDAVTGNPISGAKIRCFGLVSGQVMLTTTDEDGRYVLNQLFLPRGVIDLIFTIEGYADSLERFDLVDKNKDQFVTKLNDVRLMKTLAYGEPEKLDVAGLSPAETINELVDHIAKELSKLPVRDVSTESFNGIEVVNEPAWNSNDPDTVFKTRLTKDVEEVMDRLLNDNDDVDFQVAATLKIFTVLSTSRGGKMISFTPPISRMYKILLKNLDRNEVFDAYSEFKFSFSAPDEIEIVLDNNQSPKVRLSTIQKHLWDLGIYLVESVQRRGRGPGLFGFEEMLGLNEKAWRVGLNEFSDEQVRGEPFQNHIRASMTRVVDEIEQMPHDEEHLNAIKAVIAALDAPLKAPE